jgi:hypothetical protein
MGRIGTVREIWRYPVKSMGGESLARCTTGVMGIPGDRGWALRDERAGEIRGAKKLPQLLLCQARYLAEPAGDDIPPAEITLPDGTRVRSDDPRASARMSDLLGRPVTLWPRRPASDHEHYRRAAPDNPDFVAEMRQIFGRLEDEPLPDLTVFPPEILEFTSPLGTYFDAFPVHVLTTASIAALGGAERFDRRRFRPNFFVETDAAAPGLVETDWCGRTVRIGGLGLAIQMPTVRCVMTTLEQPELAKDPSVLRTIVKDASQNVGVYATVVDGGAVAVGDPVEVE